MNRKKREKEEIGVCARVPQLEAQKMTLRGDDAIAHESNADLVARCLCRWKKATTGSLHAT